MTCSTKAYILSMYATFVSAWRIKWAWPPNNLINALKVLYFEFEVPGEGGCGWGGGEEGRALVFSWLRLVLPTWSCRVWVPPVSEKFSLSLCLASIPWGSLSSTSSNEEVFHHILLRQCKAVGPTGPGSINLRLFQVLISHYYSGL